MKKAFVSILLIIMLSTTCKHDPNLHYSLTFVNNADHPISAFLYDSFNCNVYDNMHYNITIPPKTKLESFYSLGSRSWEYALKNEPIYYLLIFDGDSLKGVPCDTVVKYQPYKYRIALTEEYLIKNNWTITYP